MVHDTPAPETSVDARDTTAAEVAGLDALDLGGGTGPGSLARRTWHSTWPKLAAIVLALAIWQLAVASHHWPPYRLPGPWTCFVELWRTVRTGEFWQAFSVTMRRGAVGFALATVVGLAVGVLVARVSVLRRAFASLITGLQTMPSIAWFPLATLLFVDESAILFVVVLGAAPSIANGVIAGVDYVNPVLLKAGHNLGARGWRLYWHVVFPASLPSIVAGLKQGWAFSWRSLMAGELLVVIANQSSIGARLQFARDFLDAVQLIDMMIVILIIGIVVDIGFNALNQAIRRRWGVLDNTV